MNEHGGEAAGPAAPPGGPHSGPRAGHLWKISTFFWARRREPTPPDGRWRESDRLVLHRNLSYHSIHATPGGVRRGGGCRNPRSIAKKWNALPHLAPPGPRDPMKARLSKGARAFQKGRAPNAIARGP